VSRGAEHGADGIVRAVETGAGGPPDRAASAGRGRGRRAQDAGCWTGRPRVGGAVHLLAAAILLLHPAGAAAEAPDLGARGFAVRRDSILAARVARPAAPCRSDAAELDRCVWGDITLALALLQVSTGPEATERASRLLQDAAARLGTSAGWKRSADPLRPEASQRVDPAWDFPFLSAALLHRAIGLFGSARPQVAHRLSPAAEAAIREVFWNWVATECRLADADAALVWHPWVTENHDVQRLYACWAGAELSLREPAGRGRTYADGSTAAAQHAAWTGYFKALIRSRAAAGVQVEFFSPTYAKYFLGVFYNLLDFASDVELRRLSEDFVSLWWALWAQEQVGGIHGGSKARAYTRREGIHGTPLPGMSWLYFGVGERMGELAQPAHFAFLLSRYRPPEVVADLATDQLGRGAYDVWTRQPGLADASKLAERASLSPELGAIARYAHAAPGYVMGASIVPRLPAARWAAISSQNRWNGVVLADGPDARVHATPAPRGGRSTYNAVLAAQRRGTQIVQRLPPPFSRGAGDMSIWVGPKLRRVEREGWIFAEGRAYVAARPAFGGYAADAAEPAVFRLLDQRSPMVIQAGSRADHASFEAFQAAVLASPLRVDAAEVSFRGLDGAGHLRFFLDSDRRPEVDGKPLEAPTGWVLHSPFVRQAIGSSTVEIAKSGRTLRLRFD
jgi:hypothetical protein